MRQRGDRVAKGVLSERLVGLPSATETGSVALEFYGVFRSGPKEGELFGGTIHYSSHALPTQRHLGFAIFEDWCEPVMTVMVAGHRLTARNAAVYSAIPDGDGRAMDLVTLAGGSDAIGSTESVEIMFARVASDAFEADRMPSAAQLATMAVKRLLYSAPGQATSSGDILFGPSH